MVIDFRKNKSVIPPLEVNGHVFERVKSYKLLGMWIDDNLKWKTNVKYLVKKRQQNACLLQINDSKENFSYIIIRMNLIQYKKLKTLASYVWEELY